MFVYFVLSMTRVYKYQQQRSFFIHINKLKLFYSENPFNIFINLFEDMKDFLLFLLFCLE